MLSLSLSFSYTTYVLCTPNFVCGYTNEARGLSSMPFFFFFFSFCSLFYFRNEQKSKKRAKELTRADSRKSPGKIASSKRAFNPLFMRLATRQMQGPGPCLLLLLLPLLACPLFIYGASSWLFSRFRCAQ